MLQLALNNPKSKGKIEFVQGRVTRIEYYPGGSRVKGVHYVKTSPGGGGGWNSAPFLPSMENGGADTYFNHQADPIPSTSSHQVKGNASTEASEEETFLPAIQVLLAAGPWSGKLLHSLPIDGVRAHSITIRPPLKADGSDREHISAYALFTRINMADSVRNFYLLS